MSILFKLLNALTTENQSSNTPLTFTAKKNGRIVLENSANLQNEIYFKLNDNEWQLYDFEYIDLASGDTIQFENKKNTFSRDSNSFFIFLVTGEVYASGNLLSLINYSTDVPDYAFTKLFADNTDLYQAPMIPATSVGRQSFHDTFANCSNLKNCPDLPATTLANYCYWGMFFNCTSLTRIPASLPATTLAQHCYDGMFNGCESLTEMPILPATTLANYCYSNMFERCYSLQYTVSLPATTLANYCYRYMFKECSSLARIHVHFTSWPSTNYMSSWVNGVSSTGTFVKPTDLPEQFGNNRIPYGWTIENF